MKNSLCPRCNSGLHFQNEIEYCPQNHGILLTVKSLKKKTSHSFVQKLWGRWLRFKNKTTIKCPACFSKMIQINFQSGHQIELDCCYSCYAIWFDTGEYDLLFSEYFNSHKQVQTSLQSKPKAQLQPNFDKLAHSILENQKTVDRYNQIIKFADNLNQDLSLAARMRAALSGFR